MKPREELTLVLDWSSDESVYEQIARQIRTWIASGELGPGSSLPPVRSVASDLGVNLNTVARAYRLLEHEGFVRIHSRMGAVVRSPALRTDGETRALLADRLRTVLAQMRQAGHSVPELHRLARREIDSLSGGER